MLILSDSQYLIGVSNGVLHYNRKVFWMQEHHVNLSGKFFFISLTENSFDLSSDENSIFLIMIK